MKFTLAWAKVAAQNVTLKVATVTLAVVAIVQLITIAQLAMKDALVVERACFSRSLSVKPTPPTVEEIKAFLMESLPLRFDSSAQTKDEMLSIEERSSREKEQSTLKQRQMGQKIVIQRIDVSEKQIIVEADRLISLGKVRTVLPYPLSVVVKQTNRTESNPYGLVLTQTNTLAGDKEQK